MELVLVMMLGFLLVCGRSKEEKRADFKLVELLLAVVFVLLVLGHSAG
jgi:hypothetical protein